MDVVITTNNIRHIEKRRKMSLKLDIYLVTMFLLKQENVLVVMRDGANFFKTLFVILIFY